MAVAERPYDRQYYFQVPQQDQAVEAAEAAESDDEEDIASAAEESDDVNADDAENNSRGLLWSTFSGSLAFDGGADLGKPSAVAAAASTGRRNLLMLFRVFFVRGLFVDQRWVFSLLLAVSAGAYEAVAATVLNVIGDFYMAISSLDAHLFLQLLRRTYIKNGYVRWRRVERWVHRFLSSIQVLWRSLIVVTTIAALKAIRKVSKECCALVWRQGLVSYLHECYIRGIIPYVLSSTEAGRGRISGGNGHGKRGARAATASTATAAAVAPHCPPLPPLDNPDQRVTADAAALTTAFADVVHATLIVPCLVVYYTWYLVGFFGWTAPVACYMYFILASAVNWSLVKRVVPAVYEQEKAEGRFRYDHAWLRTHSESVAFYGVEAVEGRERERLGKSFDEVVTSSWAVIRRHVPLYLFTQFFDYLGSIINYAAVGGAIVYLSKADGMSSSEISALVARGSYSCLYLINAFSQGLKASKAASRVGGSAGRVAELFRATGFSDEDARMLSPWSTSGTPKATTSSSRCGCYLNSRTNARYSRSRISSSHWNDDPIAGHVGETTQTRRATGNKHRRIKATTAMPKPAGGMVWSFWFRWLWRRTTSTGASSGTDQRLPRGEGERLYGSIDYDDIHNHHGRSILEEQLEDEECGYEHGEYFPPGSCNPGHAEERTREESVPNVVSEVAAQFLAPGEDNTEHSSECVLAGHSPAGSGPRGPIAAGADGGADDGDGDDDGWLLRLSGFTVRQPEHQRKDPGFDAQGDETAGERYPLATGEGDDTDSLVNKLDLVVRKGEYLLVTGSSGCGKTSFIRSVAGIWEVPNGTIELGPVLRPKRRTLVGGGEMGHRWRSHNSRATPHRKSAKQEVMFLPQQPYCFRGTLLEQVTYPSQPDQALIPKAIAILEDLGLSHLLRLSKGRQGSLYRSPLVSLAGFSTDGVAFGGQNSPAGGAGAGDGGLHSMHIGAGGDGLARDAESSATNALLPACEEPGDGGNGGSHGTGGSRSGTNDSVLAVAVSPSSSGRNTAAVGTNRGDAEEAGLAFSPSAAAAAVICPTGAGERSRDWASILSPGEQQRLGIARILYHQPTLAFLDESTGAVSEATEDRVYRLMRAAGITVVAVGHRASLRELHDRVLSFAGPPGGQWDLSEL